MREFMVIVIFAALFGRPLAAEASGCAEALAAAAARHGVPPEWLAAATLGRPAGGEGSSPYHIVIGSRRLAPATLEAAIVETLRAQVAGAAPIAVGCGRVDLTRHPGALRLDLAFDADASADYAAVSLSELFSALGSWPEAAARYSGGAAQPEQETSAPSPLLCSVRVLLARSAGRAAPPECPAAAPGRPPSRPQPQPPLRPIAAPPDRRPQPSRPCSMTGRVHNTTPGVLRGGGPAR